MDGGGAVSHDLPLLGRCYCAFGASWHYLCQARCSRRWERPFPECSMRSSCARLAIGIPNGLPGGQERECAVVVGYAGPQFPKGLCRRPRPSQPAPLSGPLASPTPPRGMATLGTTARPGPVGCVGRTVHVKLTRPTGEPFRVNPTQLRVTCCCLIASGQKGKRRLDGGAD